MKKTVSGILLILLLTCMFTLAFDIRAALAQGETVYINSDGSVSPSSGPISSVDNLTYTLTGNITYPTYNGIVVERSNIVIDGKGYTVEGNAPYIPDPTGIGLNVTSASNVTIKNTNIKGFENGVYLYSSSNNTVSRNNETENGYDGIEVDSSSNNTFGGNNVSANGFYGIFLQGSSNNIVSGNTATANREGIFLEDSSSNNIVSGNTATVNSQYGFCLWGSSNNIISGNNVATNDNGIFLRSSSNNNVVSGNTATANHYGIILYDSSNNNTVSGNNVTANSVYGISLSGESNNTMYHNNFIGNVGQASVDSASVGNAWDDGYPSGGNYWSDYNGKDLYSGPYQNVTGSDGIGDTPYVIDANNTDDYPLINPYSPSLLSITKTVVGQGFTINMNFALANYGDYPKTLNVTVYANVTVIGTQTVNNPNGASLLLNFIWNTTGFAYGNYSLSACAANDNCTAGNVVVTIPGDLNGDFKVSLVDLTVLAKAYNSTPGDPRWNPNADINNDGKVSLQDLVILATHYGQHYP